jgi:exopolyphosphatase / guanosine-5'-triphosphate,3'-diphosphate pyrophosphatase
VKDFCPGRYAAIDVGSNSVLLLVADVDEHGRLTPVVECARITRLSERYYVERRLIRTARDRTAEVVRDFVRQARRHGAEGIATVGTSVLREAVNGAEFRTQVRQETGLPIEIISGEQEAELAYQGNLYDPRLPGTDGEHVVIDIGGGSTEIVRGMGETIHALASYRLGAVRLTELYLRSDPPATSEVVAANGRIEATLGQLSPLLPDSMLLGTGGTIYNLASVARTAGMINGCDLHGICLPHSRVSDLVDFFSTLPVKFRRRVPGLEPERADVIFAGALILHQAMAALAAPQLVVSTNGVRHGCVFAMAQRALLSR